MKSPKIFAVIAFVMMAFIFSFSASAAPFAGSVSATRTTAERSAKAASAVDLNVKTDMIAAQFKAVRVDHIFTGSYSVIEINHPVMPERSRNTYLYAFYPTFDLPPNSRKLKGINNFRARFDQSCFRMSRSRFV